MTETSYTAWDDKLYQWPPPEGWYQANDGRWWPEGYGPGPDAAAAAGAPDATESAAEPADPVSTDDADASALDMAGESEGWSSWAAPASGGTEDAISSVVGGLSADDRFGDAADRFGDASDRFGDASDRFGETAGPFGDASDRFGDASGPFGDASDRFGDAEAGMPEADVAGDSASPATTDGPAAFDDGLAAPDETMVAPGDLLAGLSGATSELPEGFGGYSNGELRGSLTDLEALPPPMVSAPVPDSGPAPDFGPAPDSGPTPESAPTGDALPPPSGEPFSPPGGFDRMTSDFDASSYDPVSSFPDSPESDDGLAEARSTESFEPYGSDPVPTSGAMDHPGLESPMWASQSPDETMIAPPAPTQVPPGTDFSAPATTGQHFGSPPADGANWGSGPTPGVAPAPGPMGPPPGPGNSFDAQPVADWAQQPYGQPGAPPQYAPGFDQAVLQPKADGVSRKVVVVALGVLLLVAIGVALYLLFGQGGNDVGGDSTAEGAFGNPHARATGVELSYGTDEANRQWIVEVLEPVRDASTETGVTPEAGEVFAATRIRVRNEAADLSAPLSELRFNVVTADGDVVEREANSCTVGDDLDYAAALPPTGSVEGSVCWQVPDGALSGLLLGIESTEVSGRVHIALQ